MVFSFDGDFNPVKVNIGQFYGIEINDFAVTVAKTALWIAESQALQETENIVHASLNFLPLKSYANIVEGNALRLDWGEVIPKEKCCYIVGNPPLDGYNWGHLITQGFQTIFRRKKNRKHCRCDSEHHRLAVLIY